MGHQDQSPRGHGRAIRRFACDDDCVPPRISSIEHPPIMFAHRGARAHAPENTIEAFTLARRLGATGLETDAWLTADGEVVLDHDGLHRRVPRKPISEVERHRLKPHIPTLGAFYAEVGADLPLSVDVKDTAAFARLVEVARMHQAAERLWVCHPNFDLLVDWRALAPEVRLVNSTRLADIPEGPERRAADLAHEGIEAVNLRRDEWTGGLTTLFHRFGVRAFGWDAQHEHQLASLIDMGIDALYSDHVDRMVAAVAAAVGEAPG